MISGASIAQTIQLILAPVVMITACGILLNGLLIRYKFHVPIVPIKVNNLSSPLRLLVRPFLSEVGRLG
jgi:hypothetical protein